LGGVGEAVFENGTAPAWFTNMKGFGYAVGAEGRKTGYTFAVYGAGMGIRKSVFEKLVEKKLSFVLSDRKGKEISSGGDAEICIIIKKAGYNIFFDSSLCFKHYISLERLHWKYYLDLRKSFGIATAFLKAYDNSAPGNLNTVGFAKQLINNAFYLTKHLHFFLFPFLFKNSACALFMQQFAMRKTLLFERNKIIGLSKQINHLF
jgi:hypothetical protein